jgi:HSP20 family protein
MNLFDTTLDWGFSPISEFDRLRLQMDELFDQFGRTSGVNGVFPAANVYDKGDDLVIALEAPGVDKGSLVAEVRDNVLILGGMRPGPSYSNASPLREECYRGEFRRNIRIGTKVQADKVKAAFKDGILVVTMPKSEEAKPKTIAIEA